MPQPSPKTEPSPLVSTTSVLILSGFLIGVAVGHGGTGDLSPYVLACGLAGMLAFVGFDLARTRRRERELLDENSMLATRLERHLTPTQPADGYRSSPSETPHPGQPVAANSPSRA